MLLISATKVHPWMDQLAQRIAASTLGRELFRAAEVGFHYEVKYLLPELDARPADILVHPRSDATATSPPTPVAYEFIVWSPFQQSFMSMGAREARAVVDAADRREEKGDC